MIGIINYGSGNIQAIANIYKEHNIEYMVITKPEELELVNRLILPGVGSFDSTMDQLEKSGLIGPLNTLVTESKTPILGICVGMQIMADSSEEGSKPGLGWISGEVCKFDPMTIKEKPYLPHMGWNSIHNVKEGVLFNKVDLKTGFYFIHSFYFKEADASTILAKASYGKDFTCAIHKGNVFGVQFHPEKSHSNGMNLLLNFATKELC